MIATSTHNAPAPMEGRGAYNRNSRVQAAGFAAAIPYFKEAARVCSLAAAPAPIAIADYGASEGHNSLVPMAAAIAVLRQRVGAERAISVVHTDLPDSDFNALFLTLANDPESYARGNAAVFPSAVGRSFYDQILPSESVTLGWTSWAVQWLSRIPEPIPDHVQVACSSDSAARTAYEAQADADWRTFLTHRAHELRAGGQLVVLTMALTDDGDFGYRAVLAAMYGALIDLVAEGKLSDAELIRMAIPTVGRGRAQLLAPFGANRHFAGLSIKQLDIFLGEDRIWEQYEQDRDAAAYGARWAAFSRASVFPTMALALDDAKNAVRVSAFLDDTEVRMAARLAGHPEPCAIPLARLRLSKESR
ncbi:MAG: hypothetical protein JNM20_03545 [Rhizobiales bacterium]|nr:hypothetical protein [Hyphomicrobiales bacterium]